MRHVTWRDLCGNEQGMCARLSKPHAHPRAGVRALIVALKLGNAVGQKHAHGPAFGQTRGGCREVER